MPVLDPSGKAAIVTGAGSGINLALAKALYSAGCGVLIADIALHRDAETWLATIKIDKAMPKIFFHKTDVTEWRQLEDVFDVFAREFGGCPDVVVPGAGVYEPSGFSFWSDADQDSHYKLFDINLTHPIKLTRIAVRRMRRAKKQGVLIHISSIAAQRPSIITPLYQASKAAVSMFIRGMAPLEDLASIRVVGVAPGAIGTPLFYDHPEALEFLDLSKDILLPAEEIAKAMIALLSDSSYPPGTVLEVGDIGKWRPVSLLNDPGPQGRATLTSKKDDAVAGVKKMLDMDLDEGSENLGRTVHMIGTLFAK